MELHDAETLAINLMTQHGLLDDGWVFAFDRATSRLGVCDFGKKRISISRHMVGAADAETVEQTLLHEIAHALLPYTVGHGWQWKAKARSIGYTGARTSHNPYVAPVKPPQQKTVVDPKTGATLSTGETFSTRSGNSYTVEKINRVNLLVAHSETGKLYQMSMDHAFSAKIRNER